MNIVDGKQDITDSSRNKLMREHSLLSCAAKVQEPAWKFPTLSGIRELVVYSTDKSKQSWVVDHRTDSQELVASVLGGEKNKISCAHCLFFVCFPWTAGRSPTLNFTSRLRNILDAHFINNVEEMNRRIILYIIWCTMLHLTALKWKHIKRFRSARRRYNWNTVNMERWSHEKRKTE